MGKSSKNFVKFGEVHYTRSFRDCFFGTLSEDIDKIIICSPYFGLLPPPFKSLLEFCKKQIQRGTENIQIITGPLNSSNNRLSEKIAIELELEGVGIFIRENPFLHAKLYHFEYSRGYFRSFVGSSNFSNGGFVNNHELVAELIGHGTKTPIHREIERLFDSRATLPFKNWHLRKLQSIDKEGVGC